jgi:hypothetical protein
MEKEASGLITSLGASTLRRKRSKSVTHAAERETEIVTRMPLSGKNPNLQTHSADMKPPPMQSTSSPRVRRPPDERPLIGSGVHLSPSNILNVRASSIVTSSSGSNSSAGDSLTTITSEGFTDYLSDESDQELQRQAEARAAELAIAKHEKDEFDAALHTVRHLSLQPPPEWNPQLPVTRPAARYPRDSFNGTQPYQFAVGHSRH